MKNNSISQIKFIRLIKILGVVLILASLMSSGCSSSAAADKKAKSKKSKAAETEEETKKTDEETEEKADKSDKKDDADKEVAKTDDEEVSNSKKSEKTSSKSEKSSNVKEETKKTDGKKTDSKKAVEVKTPSGEEVWKDLMSGNKRFMSGKHTASNYVSMRKTLLTGQHPPVIVLGCADSRVPPELLFDKNLGEIFVVRDAGNVADEVTLGSIEYAIEHLHAKVLVILGHESCGAVAAAVSGEDMPTKNLQAIIDRITPAFEGSKECLIGGKMNLACVELNVKESAADVQKQSSIIKKAMKENLTIIKAVYHLDTGEVVRLD